MAEENNEQENSGKKGGLGKILVLVFILLDISVLGGGAFLVYQSTLGYQPPVVREEVAYKDLVEERESREESKVALYTLDQFVVNLAGAPRRMIRLEMSLEMLDEEGFEEVVSLGSEARDAIVRILSSKDYDEIETIQGKLFLKDQIAVTLNSFLREGVVKDIYFSDFVVQ